MKKLLLIATCLSFLVPAFAQSVGQSFLTNIQMPYLRLMKADTVSPGSYVMVRQSTGWLAVVPSSNFVTTTYTGFDSRYKLTSYVPSWSEITAKPPFATVAFSADYNDLANRPPLSFYPNSNPLHFVDSIFVENRINFYNAGMGIKKTGSEPNATLSVDPSVVMMAQSATDSIAAIKSLIGTKLNAYDSFTYQTKYRSDSMRAAMWPAINAKLSSIDSTIWQSKYRSDTGRANAYTAINGKQTQINGAGFVRANGTAISYDNSSYYLSSNPNGYISSVPAQSFTSLTGKPTTLSGYGITDAYPLSGNPAGFLTSEVDGSIINEIQTLSRVGDSLVLSSQTAKVYAPLGNFNPTINNAVARTLNSNYTVSTTKNTFVSYAISLSVTNPLLAGASTASVFLEYSTNGGSSWLLVNQAVNTSSVALAVAIAITNVQTSTLAGYIPANALVRLRTTTSGTASVSYMGGQETTF